MNKLYLLFGIVFLLSIGYAEGVACTNISITDGCTITGLLTLVANQTFYVNDTDTFGIVTMKENSSLDCQGSTIIGNTTGRCINTNTVNNITVKNCICNNYGRGINIQTVNGYDLQNNTFINCALGINILSNSINGNIHDNILNSSSSAGIQSTVGCSNINITNNYIRDSKYSIYMLGDNMKATGNTIINGSNVCLYSSLSNNTIITGNSVINCTNDIIVSNGWNNTVTNNYVYNNKKVSGEGILLTGSGTGHIVSNNTIFTENKNITYYYYGIKINANNTNSIISYNTISNCYEGIQTFANNTNIFSNWVNNSGWNNIQFYSYYNIIYNNTVLNWGHQGIDTHNEGNTTISGYTNISFNILRGEICSSTVTGIYSTDSIGNNIFNNSITNCGTGSLFGTGIAIDGGSSSAGHNIYNNYINVTTGYCMYDYGTNNLWYNNIIDGCPDGSLITGGYPFPEIINNGSFYNNTYLDNTAKFHTNSQLQNNYTINENVFSINITIATAKIISNYSGLKNWRIDNLTLSLINQLLQYPNNDVKNTSNGVILASNVDNFTITLSPNQQIEVGDFITDYCSSNVKMVCDYNNICRDIITGCVVNDSNTRSTIVWCANE